LSFIQKGRKRKEIPKTSSSVKRGAGRRKKGGEKAKRKRGKTKVAICPNIPSLDTFWILLRKERKGKGEKRGEKRGERKGILNGPFKPLFY